ncbi:DNA-binding response regulator [Lentzea sp. BCCO 10_0061]|uniref:DNA-binding response regulator n=1 Tax=Lentzea sokolovensis TaxID=3095429 RepID=A0ABU4V0W3_9PSEU|nr:DNA-binding response regulator [Lentzea sp. BCCO 10_0061]MDX8145007.1 DNA-binding response regulator [Lentzea sp. BCCO 10_0061]
MTTCTPDVGSGGMISGRYWKTEEGSVPQVTVHIAVVDPLPMFRQGAATVLAAAGHVVEMPGDVVKWLDRAEVSLVLLSVVDEQDWDLLASLAAPAARHLIIALLEDESPVPGMRALRAGARSVLPRDVDAATLTVTVEATIKGRAVLPSVAVAALVAGGGALAHPVPSADQLSWLRRLAAGVTVAKLADQAGYSERAMFRMLQALYRQLGTHNRIEAILHAQARGWL